MATEFNDLVDACADDEQEEGEGLGNCWDDILGELEQNKSASGQDLPPTHRDTVGNPYDLADAKLPDPRQVDKFRNELRQMPPWNGALPADIEQMIDRFKHNGGTGTLPRPEDVRMFEDRLRSSMPPGPDGRLPPAVEDFIRRMHRAANRNDPKLNIQPGDLPVPPKPGKS